MVFALRLLNNISSWAKLLNCMKLNACCTSVNYDYTQFNFSFLRNDIVWYWFHCSKCPQMYCLVSWSVGVLICVSLAYLFCVFFTLYFVWVSINDYFQSCVDKMYPRLRCQPTSMFTTSIQNIQLFSTFPFTHSNLAYFSIILFYSAEKRRFKAIIGRSRYQLKPSNQWLQNQLQTP